MESKDKKLLMFGVVGLCLCLSIFEAKGQSKNRSNFTFGKEPKTVIVEDKEQTNRKTGLNEKFSKSPSAISSRKSIDFNLNKSVVTFGKYRKVIRQSIK